MRDFEPCNCYRTREEIHYFTDLEKGYYLAKGISKNNFEVREISKCYGTKECEPCKCGGDRAKCDFYEDVRRKAQKEKNRKNKLNQALENISMIIDIGFDYDGFEKSEDLKDIIDELVDYAKKARKNISDYIERKN